MVATKIIIRDREENLYDDSYFHYTYVDLVEGRVGSHMHSCTAYAGVSPLENSKMLSEATEAEVRCVDYIIHLESIKAIEQCSGKLANDVVRIVKGRKFAKGFEFTYIRTDEYRDMYGRLQALYAVGVDSYGVQVRTNINNIEFVSRTLHTNAEAVKEANDQIRYCGYIYCWNLIERVTHSFNYRGQKCPWVA